MKNKWIEKLFIYRCATSMLDNQGVQYNVYQRSGQVRCRGKFSLNNASRKGLVKRVTERSGQTCHGKVWSNASLGLSNFHYSFHFNRSNSTARVPTLLFYLMPFSSVSCGGTPWYFSQPRLEVKLGFFQIGWLFRPKTVRLTSKNRGQRRSSTLVG
jgi:hypothetical protein